ncbi:Protein HIR1 [Penicillium oxalicum]|uniref:Protein HIR1 n=1 Tax=Penicillium oxalicum TaxID=69781 RepID=UPI0020B83939|nr:Protein HIR1 [Penicillium oxalicum]KAI2790209.1 Protein HIR1 [Penicillium oxalicum]
MHIIKPVWLTHGGERKDFEVYSCDVSPDGKRLVTAAGDGYVRIWSTEAIHNTDKPEFASKPKQLASMSNHSGTIHTVRFSPNGKYLASGADDKIVCVYTLDSSPPTHSTFGSDEAPPVENWRTIRRLIGHDNDVQDLGWSHDSSILVSVGLDSKIVVWSGHTFEKLKTIVVHQSHVKGITFDPANKYFATASDDRTVRIFRFTSPGPNSTSHDQMNNFMLEHTITAPFANSPLTAYFRRCSWSPDGMHIAAANAVNGPVSSVAIINRGSWDGDINLIGHEAPVEVCSFSPRLYSKEPIDKHQTDNHVAQHHITVIACAGADKSLSVWITSNARPIVVAQEMAAKSMSDLAWSPDGKCLYATALDGTILAVRFEDGELGWATEMEENEKSLTKFGTNRKGAGITETTDGLLLEEQSKAGELRGVEGRMGALMGDGHAQPAATNGNSRRQQQQRLRRRQQLLQMARRLPEFRPQRRNGRKRIAPLLVSGAGAGESSLPQTRLMASVSSQVKGDAPTSIVDLSKPFDGLPKGGLTTLLFGNKRRLAQLEGEEEGQVEKRVAVASQNGATPILSNTLDGLLPAVVEPPVSGQQPTPEFIRPAVTNPCMSISQTRLAVPKIRSFILRALDPNGKPTEPPNQAGESNAKDKGRIDVVFEAKNPSPASLTGRAVDREPVRLTLFRGEQPLWQDFLPKCVLLVTGNQNLWAAACEDGSVYLWTPAGRRLVSALVLEAQPVILECNGPWVLCISSVGMCYVWNVKHLSSPHPPISLQPVLDAAIHTLGGNPTSAPAVTDARINSEGRIVVSLTNGEGYSYSPAMYTWQRVSEAWWAVGSQYWNSTDAPVGNLQAREGSQENKESKAAVSAGIIPFLERNTTNETLLRGRAYFLQRLIKVLLSREGYETFESSVSIAHLENRMAAALSLGAKEEFRLYLNMYAKRIGAEGLKGKVEELLKGLIGGLFDDEDGSETVAKLQANEHEGRNWREGSDDLCGWPRETLLKEVILALGKYRELQRVTVPYAKLLDMVDTTSEAGDAMDL